MGNAGSSASRSPSSALGARARLDEPPGKAAGGKSALLSGLARSGRYVSVAMPNGATVHLLGVFPCSSRSEEEAHGLVGALAPSHVYVDLAPEWVAALQEEVDAGRVGGWAIPDATPPFRLYPGAGVLGSVLIRNNLADNDMLGLMGAEWYGAYKAGLAAARKQQQQAAAAAAAAWNGAPAAAAAAAGTPSGPSSTGPKVLAFPFSMHYNNGETLDRPSAFTCLMVGNSSFASDAVHALAGANAAIMAGEPAQAETTVQLPPAGYFTRQQVSDVQRSWREKANGYVAAATAGTADVEADLHRREAAAREAGNEGDAQTYAMAALRSQIQSQAVAHSLQAAAEEAGAGGHVVALVNLGSLASLTRNWEEARPPQVLVPPLGAWVTALQYVAPGLLAGSLAYGGYRAFRRFPKTTGVLGVLAAGAGGIFAYNLVYSDGMRYGFGLRAALARPRVTSPVGGIKKL